MHKRRELAQRKQLKRVLCFIFAVLLSLKGLSVDAALIVSPTFSSLTDQDHIDLATGLPVTQGYVLGFTGTGYDFLGSGYLLT